VVEPAADEYEVELPDVDERLLEDEDCDVVEPAADEYEAELPDVDEGLLVDED